MLEWLPSAVTVLDWLRKLFRGRSESAQSPVVVNPGVPPEFAEQSNAIARELGRMETENAWLRSENADLRKARDAAIADLRQRSQSADDPSLFKKALEELGDDHTETAEVLFRGIVMKSRREAAFAACTVGSLAFHHNTQKALLAYEEAVELDPNTAYAWLGIGHLQKQMGRLEEAEAAFGKVLDLDNSNDSDLPRASALSNIGALSAARGDLDMAENKFMAALKLYKELDNAEGMARAYCSIGNVHLLREDWAGAEGMYRKSLVLNENVGDKEIMMTIYSNLGLVLCNMGNLDGAREMFGKSLRVNEDLDPEEGMAVSYVGLGVISGNQENLEEACCLWKKARDMFSDMGARDEVEYVEQLMQNAGCEL